jgi:hypothetical protein
MVARVLIPIVLSSAPTLAANPVAVMYGKQLQPLWPNGRVRA